MRHTTVSLTLTRGMIRYAVARGASLERLCAAAGITPGRLASPDERITGEQSHRAWQEAVAATGDPDFGLHLGELTQPAGLGLVGFVMLSATEFETALQSLLRYTNLLTDGVRGTLSVRGAEAVVQLSPVSDLVNPMLAAPRQRIETTFSALLSLAFALTGRALPVRAVEFLHPAPPGTTEHRRIFRAPVAFSRPANRLVFDAAALRWPLVEAQPALRQALETQAAEMLARIDQSETWFARVQREIARHLRETVPDLAFVARALGVGARTLQRHLGAEGVSFRDALDRVRETLARRHLASPGVTVDEVSFLLGFSEPSAFHRSFKRWTGLTPQAYRAQAAQAG
jgi:AraC-like DNA-binding protein